MDDLLFGLRTTVLGMGIVFGVLAILWILLTVVVKLDERSARASAAAAAAGDAAAGTTVAAPLPTATGTDARADADPAAATVRLVGAPDYVDPRLVAAVTVAILRHAEARRLQAAPAMRSYWPGSLLFASRWVAAGRTRQGQSWRRRR